MSLALNRVQFFNNEIPLRLEGVSCMREAELVLKYGSKGAVRNMPGYNGFRFSGKTDVYIMLARGVYLLGKGPKIKKRESMVFDHTPAIPP